MPNDLSDGDHVERLKMSTPLGRRCAGQLSAARIQELLVQAHELRRIRGDLIWHQTLGGGQNIGWPVAPRQATCRTVGFVTVLYRRLGGPSVAGHAPLRHPAGERLFVDSRAGMTIDVVCPETGEVS